jgi:NAD+ synthase
VQWIANWFKKNGRYCNAVIGISGGKDSSVAAALCVQALGKDRVIGVLMPNGVQKDIDDAVKIVTHLGIKYTVVNIAKAFYATLNNMGEMFMPDRDGYEEFKISEQTKINLSPRIRMSTLYAVSQSVNGRVVGTDNASEAFIGYSTRWGDNVADLMPLINLTTNEVIAIGDELGLPYDLVHKTPSDGLCGKTDEDSFGFTYGVLNKYIRTGVCEDEEAKALIDDKHNKNLFKLQPIPSFPYEEK